ncbi:hypothetical protein D3C71_1650410 [compost metagenome]
MSAYKAQIDAIRSLLPEFNQEEEEQISDILQDCISSQDAATEICDLFIIPRRTNRTPISDALKAAGYN